MTVSALPANQSQQIEPTKVNQNITVVAPTSNNTSEPLNTTETYAQNVTATKDTAQSNPQDSVTVSEQELTISKIKTAQSKQSNQDKLEFETLQGEVDDEMEDFPIVLDSNIKPEEDQNKAQTLLRHGQNQNLLEDIIVNGEIEENKQEEK